MTFVLASLLTASISASHDVEHCVAIANDKLRLACFDATAIGTPAADDVADQVEDDSGSEADEGSSVAKDKASTVVSTFTVARVGLQPRGEHVVFLSNGDVWKESFASRYFPVTAGDQVTIKKRRFSGYRLIAPNGKAFNVQKMR